MFDPVFTGVGRPTDQGVRMQIRLKQKTRKALDERVMEKLWKQGLHFSTKARYTRNAAWNNFETSEARWFEIKTGDSTIVLEEPRFVIMAASTTTIVCQGYYPPGRRDQVRIFHLIRNNLTGMWLLSDEPIEWLAPYTRQMVET